MYIGKIIGRDEDRVILRDGKEPIKLYLDKVNHSPTGFSWGYGGSGPAQASFAILMDYLKDEIRAKRLYQDFKDKVVSKLDMNKDFLIPDRLIEDFITETELERMTRK